jgi:hypothetical protein
MSGDVPSWVPPAVKALAQVVLVGDADKRQRLLTDPRMKRVWLTLRSATVVPEALDAWEQQQRNWTLPKEGLPKEGEPGCAAFYACAVQELTYPRTAWTRAQATEWAKDWDKAATLSRWITWDPMFDPEHRKAAAIMAECFAKHGTLLKEQGRVVDLGQDDAPYFLGRSSRKKGKKGGDQASRAKAQNEARARARALAFRTRAIFGRYLYSPIATVVTVALQIEPRITPKSVTNWCADLPPA